MYRINNNKSGTVNLQPIKDSIAKIQQDTAEHLEAIQQLSENQNLTWFTLNSISQRTDALMISDVYNVLTKNTINYAVNNSVNYYQEYKVPYCHAVSENNDIYHKQLTESSEILSLLNPTTYTHGANLQSISIASRNSNIYTDSVFNPNSFYFYGMNDYNLLKNYNYGVFIEPQINNDIMGSLTYDAVLHAPTITSSIYDLNFASVNDYIFYNRSDTWSLSFNSNNHSIQSFEYHGVKSMTMSQNVNIYGLNAKTASFSPFAKYQTSSFTNTKTHLNLTQCSIDNLMFGNVRLCLNDCTIHNIVNPHTNYTISITVANQTIDSLCATDGKLEMFKNTKDLTMNNATLSAASIYNSAGITYNDCLLNVSDGISHSMILNATNCSITAPYIANINQQLDMHEEFKNCSLNVSSYSIGKGNIIGFDNCTLNTGISLSGDSPTVDFKQCQGLQWIDGTVNYPTFNFNSMNNTGLTIASDFSYTLAPLVSLVNCSSFTYFDAFQSAEYYITNMKDCKLQVGNLSNIETVSDATLTLYDLDTGSIRTFNPTLLGNNSINFTCDSTATYKISAPNYGGADAILKIDGWDDTQSKNACISILPNIKQLTINNCSVSFITNWPTINKTISLYNNSYINDTIQISGLNYVGMDNENGGQPFSSLTLRSNESLVLGKNIGKSVGVFDCTHPIFQNCRPNQLLAYTCDIVDINDTKISGSMEFKNCNFVVFNELNNISHHATLSFKDCNIVDFYLCTNVKLDAAAFDNVSRMGNPVSQIRTISIKPSDDPFKYCHKYTSIVNI